jgi:hypothetical protein
MLQINSAVMSAKCLEPLCYAVRMRAKSKAKHGAVNSIREMM